MKKVLLAAMAVCAVFASCSNNDENDKPAGSGQEAKVSINITAPENRASGTTVPADASVSNFSAFVTDGTTILGSGYCSAPGTGLTVAGGDAISASTTATDVFVVANAGDLTSTITTLTALNGYLADLDDATLPQRNIRWATGKNATALSFALNAGGDMEASTTVALTFIAARITVKVDNQMINYSGAGILATIPEAVLDGVAVMNARGQSLLFGSPSLVPTTYSPVSKTYYEGLAYSAAFTNFPAIANYTMATTWLADALPATTSAIAYPDTYYYYVFENNSITDVTYPTIVTIVGKDENGADTYWPVHLAPYEQWGAGSGAIGTTGVTRGNSYDINITLTGDAQNGGGGVVNPTIPVTTAFVEVQITLTPWVPVVLNKTF